MKRFIVIVIKSEMGTTPFQEPLESCRVPPHFLRNLEVGCRAHQRVSEQPVQVSDLGYRDQPSQAGMVAWDRSCLVGVHSNTIARLLDIFGSLLTLTHFWH